MEGFLLLGALGILCVLFGFFALELQDISLHAFGRSPTSPEPQTNTPLTPPRVEARVLGSALLLVTVDETGNPLQTLYSSDLSDDIADFTLFAIPQTGYQGFIYLRPILDGKLPNLKIYPLDVASGTLKAATLNVPADDFVLSADETLVATRADDVLTLYALEDGAVVATGTIPPDWQTFVAHESATLMLSSNSCMSLTSSLAQPDLTPFPEICP
jgi:hypothetical protein